MVETNAMPWHTEAALQQINALMKAANDLCLAAETACGTAGRDDFLCAAIAHYAATRDKVAQRALARCRRGSKRRAKVRARLEAAHAAISRARRTFHFQTAADLVGRFGMIAIESLNIKGLAGSVLARDVNDAAWGQFTQILCDKAESAGRRVVKVDPRGTSQTCPDCGQVKPKTLAERVHRCDCGYTADRDVAAARVILFRAVHGPGKDNVGGCAERSCGKEAA